MCLSFSMREKLNAILSEYTELQRELSAPETASDMEKLKALGKSISKIENTAQLVQEYFRVEEEIKGLEEMRNDPEMMDMAEEEEEKLLKEKQTLENALQKAIIPKDPNDEKDCILEIRPAAGGDEAALFAGDLSRMYLRFAEIEGFTSEIFSKSETEDGGIKEIIFAVRGNGAHGKLKYESGVHRIQRVPTTESKGRIHTSTATVVVLPEVEESEVDINPEDVRVDVYRASGAGGQHVNKTESAVRLTHIPTGIVVACQDERSQFKNKSRAFAVLRSRIKASEEEKVQKAGSEKRLEQIGTGDRSEKIRTYNIPQDRVTDHRIKQNFSNIPVIFNGEISGILEACHAAQVSLQSDATF